MKPVIVLACDGEFSVAHAIAALTGGRDAEVVTVTLDIGQASDVRATRDQALAAGAVRAHVFDAMDEFVRACVLPALQSAPAAGPVLASRATLAYPLIAARLVDVAQLERTRVVAHGGDDELGVRVRMLDPALQVLTIDPRPFGVRGARGRRMVTAARHLLQRPVADPAAARGVPARIDIAFSDAVPVAVNGVALSPAELIESLSLIGGEHGIGHAEAATAPGALVLDAAYRALHDRSGTVRIELLDGRHRVLPVDDQAPELVIRA